ncbi:hypothetical protein LEP1GSC035_2779 [Leptospira noguchii str. 2007001578]|uniref:Uncharacterized protein n=2 Tax=Leptospira noguchii TaxID=28182 RepID=M6YEV8_9LEPT|nr:hypothetical protein LEP1GSC035_2779 [Leptospira noguchii str. 2007001578]EMO90381.1 hypothetical protein LEP1GSC024_4570 [Leptospira noguchii str. 2001034031]
MKNPTIQFNKTASIKEKLMEIHFSKTLFDKEVKRTNIKNFTRYHKSPISIDVFL